MIFFGLLFHTLHFRDVVSDIEKESWGFPTRFLTFENILFNEELQKLPKILLFCLGKGQINSLTAHLEFVQSVI